MSERLIVEVETISKSIPVKASFGRWIKNALYYGLRVRRYAVRQNDGRTLSEAFEAEQEKTSHDGRFTNFQNNKKTKE